MFISNPFLYITQESLKNSIAFTKYVLLNEYKAGLGYIGHLQIFFFVYLVGLFFGFVLLCFLFVCLLFFFFFFPSPGLLLIHYAFWFWVFRGFLHANVCLSVSICIPCAVSLALFFPVCFVLFRIFDFFLFYCIITFSFPFFFLSF